MATKIENVIHQAIKTFTKSGVKKPPEVLKSDLLHLKSLVDEVTVEDLPIPMYFLRKNTFLGTLIGRKRRTVEYFSVYEDSDVTIGVFVVEQNGKLPLHDHPCMYGFLKVVHGTFKVKSYSVLQVDKCGDGQKDFYYEDPLNVATHPEVTVEKEDGACGLTPVDRNFHEVTCVNGPGAFLDVLSPPYDSSSRSCHYFEVLKCSDENTAQLIQIPTPEEWA